MLQNIRNRLEAVDVLGLRAIPGPASMIAELPFRVYTKSINFPIGFHNLRQSSCLSASSLGTASAYSNRPQEGYHEGPDMPTLYIVFNCYWEDA